MSVATLKTILGLALVVSLGFAVTPAQAAPSGGCVVAATTTCTFIYTGAPEAWVVPAGVTSAVFDLDGAAGGNLDPITSFFSRSWPGGSGGKGARVQATVALTPATTLNLRVGGKGTDGLYSTVSPGIMTVAGGFNGGGTNSITCNACAFILGGGGGGSSDVRTSADGLANRLLVAGGGGGAGPGGADSGDPGLPDTGDPGDGGNSATGAKSVTGVDDLSGPFTCPGGGPGTLAGPGAAGAGGCFSGASGDPGGLFGGGNNGQTGVGAGGGGYFGGGAGAFLGPTGTGGGGGSDYPNPLSPPAGISNVTITDGVQAGNGIISVTYTIPLAVTIASESATRRGRGVLVRWRTGTEADTLGFNVYRQQGARRVRLNRSVLPALGSMTGASYSYRDRRAPRHRALRYWLQDVALDGTRTWHGPVRVAAVRIPRSAPHATRAGQMGGNIDRQTGGSDPSDRSG